MTRRVTSINAPNVNASAPTSSTSCMISARCAEEYCITVWSRAASSAASATLTAADSRPTVIGLHWIRGQFGLLAGDQRRQQAIAQGEVFRFEIGLLGGGHRARKRRRQLHARGGQFQRIPGGIGAAAEFGVGRAGLRRRLSGAESVGDQQRSFARGVTQQPGDLLDREQLVDHRVLMVDVGGKRSRQFVERGEQRACVVSMYSLASAGRRGDSLGWVMASQNSFCCACQLLEQAVEFRDQRRLLRELDLAEQTKRVAHRRHFGVAKAAQIFFDVAVHRRVAIQQPVGGGAVGAQIVHRLEHIGGCVGDHRDAARHLQAAPGIPGVERETHHDAERGGQDDGLQQRGYGQTIQHDAPPKLPAIWG